MILILYISGVFLNLILYSGPFKLYFEKYLKELANIFSVFEIFSMPFLKIILIHFSFLFTMTVLRFYIVSLFKKLRKNISFKEAYESYFKIK